MVIEKHIKIFAGNYECVNCECTVGHSCWRKNGTGGSTSLDFGQINQWIHCVRTKHPNTKGIALLLVNTQRIINLAKRGLGLGGGGAMGHQNPTFSCSTLQLKISSKFVRVEKDYFLENRVSYNFFFLINNVNNLNHPFQIRLLAVPAIVTKGFIQKTLYVEQNFAP